MSKLCQKQVKSIKFLIFNGIKGFYTLIMLLVAIKKLITPGIKIIIIKIQTFKKRISAN